MVILPLLFSFGIPPANNPSGRTAVGDVLLGGRRADGDSFAAPETEVDDPNFSNVKADKCTI